MPCWFLNMPVRSLTYSISEWMQRDEKVSRDRYTPEHRAAPGFGWMGSVEEAKAGWLLSVLEMLGLAGESAGFV